MKKYFFPFAAGPLLVLAACVASQRPGEQLPEPPQLIPLPSSLSTSVGQLTLGPDSKVLTSDRFSDEVHRQVHNLRQTTKLALEFDALAANPTHSSKNAVLRVLVDESIAAEGYRLQSADNTLLIEASTDAGVFYAFQTLRQLLPSETESGASTAEVSWTIPVVNILDGPRFPYRGLHLDVGRHFFDVDYVKSMLDTMALYKFNRFHWHLTEDQGWRIQIDAFPKLTEVGAWRAETQVADNFKPFKGDGQRYGGFYSKDEIREVVAYAAERHIQVVPEIEMPGHASAALAAYPEFGCTAVAPAVQAGWGVMENIFCPREETFSFLFTVLDEVMELFPSEYIHIGADEVPKRQWQDSAQAQAVMRREGLDNEDQLQSYFVRRIEQHLNSRGRRLIGWDEILEGGLAPDATVMTWRNDESAVSAAQMGHDVIRTPHQHSYFDFYQGPHDAEPLAMSWAQHDITLETVYAFEPIPTGLNTEQAAHIVGAQANLWTEYIATTEHAEYMLYPRALALAEVAWSTREVRDWLSFTLRLPEHLKRLQLRGVNYRWPTEVYETNGP